MNDNEKAEKGPKMIPFYINSKDWDKIAERTKAKAKPGSFHKTPDLCAKKSK